MQPQRQPQPRSDQNLIPHFIGGKMVPGQGKHLGNVYNPATGDVIKQVAYATSHEVNAVVESASKALPGWSETPSLRRARILFKFKDLLEKYFDDLVRIIVTEHGKVWDDASGELMRGIEVVEFACGIPHLLKGSFSENVGRNIDSHSMHQPVGVCVGISPFNFPVMIPMWMYPIALACGNTFVLKPSEKDPSISVRCAELLSEAGLKDGVFNVIHGDKDVVDALIQHPQTSAISFVGSTPVAKDIYAKSAAAGKRVQALGGAKNHCIVMPDADMELAVNGIMGGAFGSAGQRCMAIPVVVAVGDSTGDFLASQLENKLKTLHVGSGLDSQSQMGPLITQEHRNRVQSYIDLGVEEGANLIVDGRNIKIPGHENGFFLGGCLFDHVKPNMRIYQEEIFGPVLSMVRAPDFETALDLVNNHQFGNGSTIYTKSGEISRRFSTSVRAGMVGINVPIPVPMAFYSFGGCKDSLFGSSYMHGSEGIRFYTLNKTVTTRWSSSPTVAEFKMPTMT